MYFTMPLPLYLEPITPTYTVHNSFKNPERFMLYLLIY